MDIGPAVAHSHAGLPGVWQQRVGHLLLGSTVILVSASHTSVDDNHPRVLFSGHGSDARHVDILHLTAASKPRTRLVVDAPRRTYPTAIKPKDIYAAVVVRKFVYLVVGEITETLPAVGMISDGIVDITVGQRPLMCPIIIAMPVGLGEIETRPETRAAEGIDHSTGKISLRRTFLPCAAVVGLLGVEHTESIVVLGGEDHILHARLLSRCSPSFRVEMLRIEGLVQGLISLLILIKVLPFCASDRSSVGTQPFSCNPRFVADAPTLHHTPLGINAPVHHKTELEVLPFPDTFHNVRMALGDGIMRLYQGLDLAFEDVATDDAIVWMVGLVESPAVVLHLTWVDRRHPLCAAQYRRGQLLQTDTTVLNHSQVDPYEVAVTQRVLIKRKIRGSRKFHVSYLFPNIAGARDRVLDKVSRTIAVLKQQFLKILLLSSRITLGIALQRLGTLSMER